MTAADVEFLAAADVDGASPDEVICDFGPLGLWLWVTGTWVQISGADPDSR
jgi:hypothetical protein